LAEESEHTRKPKDSGSHRHWKLRPVHLKARNKLEAENKLKAGNKLKAKESKDEKLQLSFKLSILSSALLIPSKQYTQN
jgi:hypothetical protein